MQTNNPSLVLMTYYMCMCTVVISMYVWYGMVWYVFWCGNILKCIIKCVRMCVCMFEA